MSGLKLLLRKTRQIRRIQTTQSLPRGSILRTQYPSPMAAYSTTAMPDVPLNSKSTPSGNVPPAERSSNLPLPEPSEKTQTLDMSSEGGGTAKLDHLGPLVVNVDGTLSRIANWEHMAEIERKNTLRILGRRNKERLAALKRAGLPEAG
jgi:hypothetical protein